MFHIWLHLELPAVKHEGLLMADDQGTPHTLTREQAAEFIATQLEREELKELRVIRVK